MAKKRLGLVFFMALPLLAAAGADFSLSAGAGGFLGGLFTRYTLKAHGNVAGLPADVDVVQHIDQLNYGASLFIDIPWLEFSANFLAGNNRYREDTAAVSGEDTLLTRNNAGTGREMMLGLGLLGKYPFSLGDRLTVFPLAGLEYQIALLEYRKPDRFKGYHRTDGIRETNVDGKAHTLAVWNSLLIDIGGGLDFFFQPRLFLRAEALCGFRLPTPYENDGLAQMKKLVHDDKPKLGGLTASPVLKLYLGYRFL